MLQNAYFLAKIGADTAENERTFAENSPTIGNYPTGASGPGPRRPQRARVAADTAYATALHGEVRITESTLSAGLKLLYKHMGVISER